FATLLLARQTRQRILHQPHIATMLDGARRHPRLLQAANWPWPPDPRIRWAIECNCRTSGPCSKVRDRRIRADIDLSSRQVGSDLAPAQVTIETQHRCCHALPNRIEIRLLGLTWPPRRHDFEATIGKRGGERTPTFVRPLLVAEHRRRVDH